MLGSCWVNVPNRPNQAPPERGCRQNGQTLARTAPARSVPDWKPERPPVFKSSKANLGLNGQSDTSQLFLFRTLAHSFVFFCTDSRFRISAVLASFSLVASGAFWCASGAFCCVNGAADRGAPSPSSAAPRNRGVHGRGHAQ